MDPAGTLAWDVNAAKSPEVLVKQLNRIPLDADPKASMVFMSTFAAPPLYCR